MGAAYSSEEEEEVTASGQMKRELQVVVIRII